MPQDFLQELQDDINTVLSKGHSVGKLSDGHHTFDELYRHRNVLFMALCKEISNNVLSQVWMSKTQSDGTPVQEGWFILGTGKRAGKQITYHLPVKYWEQCQDFAKELPQAYEFDGHTSADVIDRLLKL